MGFTVTFPYMNAPCVFLSVFSPIMTVKVITILAMTEKSHYHSIEHGPTVPSPPHTPSAKTNRLDLFSVVIIVLSTEFWV